LAACRQPASLARRWLPPATNRQTKERNTPSSPSHSSRPLWIATRAVHTRLPCEASAADAKREIIFLQALEKEERNKKKNKKKKTRAKPPCFHFFIFLLPAGGGGAATERGGGGGAAGAFPRAAERGVLGEGAAGVPPANAEDLQDARRAPRDTQARPVATGEAAAHRVRNKGRACGSAVRYCSWLLLLVVCWSTL
jgi:hypothetical protein